MLKAAISYSYVVGVLFVWDCHNRVPQSGGMMVYITEMSFLAVLEAGICNLGGGRAGYSGPLTVLHPGLFLLARLDRSSP